MIKMTLLYNYIFLKKKRNVMWKKKYLKFRKKNFCIPKILRNCNIFIHQGKQLIKRQVYSHMIGRKVGEFCLTRKPFFYPPKKKKR